MIIFIDTFFGTMSDSYAYGFTTPVEHVDFPCGLSDEIIKAISAKRNEPQWLLAFREQAYMHWKSLQEPHWANVHFEPIQYQSLQYFSEHRSLPKLAPQQIDPSILQTLERLKIPLGEQQRLLNVSVDVVFDSVSLKTAVHDQLASYGIIACPLSEAVHSHEHLVKKYLGSVVPSSDNYFAALNSAVFSDGSFVYIPKGVHCPIELSTYFRLNNKKAGQFERTLIIAEEQSYVSYLEGCTAPAFDAYQLHGAVVELVAHAHSHIRYSTVQNWYSGDPLSGKGGVLNFVTKRGVVGDFAKISWTQVEAGAAITWKYPSCILEGVHSCGEFYSVSLTEHHMQADTGSKMIHKGAHSKSTIITKSIATGKSNNTYRGLVSIGENAHGSYHRTQCDSMLVGPDSSTYTIPTVVNATPNSRVEHEASTSRLSEEQLRYFRSRGCSQEEAIIMIVAGFCDTVLERLPLEFAQEAKHLLSLKLEGAVG